ncbi:MAG: histidine phosphatase family protein [Chthoniobacterales bacterium]
MKRRLALALLLAVLASGAHAEPPTIFLVRHAEKAAGDSKDPDLSPAGRARAEALATVLKDANLTAIYTTEFKRTQETAAPTAHAAALQPITVSANDTAQLLEKLTVATGRVLVVSHGNTLPNILKGLGLTTSIKIEEPDYDNLFLVIPGAPPQLVHLHYR